MLVRFYQETDVTVSWDPINNWVLADWRNAPARQTVVNGCEQILKLLMFMKATSVLNDNRQITGTWVGASRWVAEEWFPRMIASGLKKFAWVESPLCALSVVSAKRAVMKNEAGVIKLFKNEDKAQEWLSMSKGR
jgi:hypothetical protein